MVRREMYKALAAIVLAVGVTGSAGAQDDAKHIFIVDMGNIMRSVIAENLIERRLEEDGLADEFTVASRGLQGTPAIPVVPTHANLSYYNEANGSNAWPQSKSALEELGLVEVFKEYKATVVSERDLEAAEIIIVTDEEVMDHPEHGLNAQFPGHDEKMILITELIGSQEGIADAYQAGTEGNKYAKTVHEVADVVERGYPNLLDRLK